MKQGGVFDTTLEVGEFTHKIDVFFLSLCIERQQRFYLKAQNKTNNQSVQNICSSDISLMLTM